jgi:hypothetical protein
VATITTCQICARAIQAKKGVIAHHGYRRPQRHSGWQTSSCPGARSLPYEVSRDRLYQVIEGLRGTIETEEKELTRFLAEPPDSLSYRKHHYGASARNPYDLGELITVPRPADFDRNGPSFQVRTYLGRSYEYLYAARERELKESLKNHRFLAVELQARYDAWVPPAQEVK